MKAGPSALPYSRKALQTLADTLKIHRSMVWLDPVTNSIGIKQFTPQNRRVNLRDSYQE